MSATNSRARFQIVAEETALSIFIVVTHTAVAAVLIAAFWALERLIHYLYGEHDPMVLNLVPLRFIIEGADALLIVGVLIFGTISAYRTLRS